MTDKVPSAPAGITRDEYFAIQAGSDACFCEAAACERAARNRSDPEMASSADGWRRDGMILRTLLGRIDESAATARVTPHEEQLTAVPPMSIAESVRLFHQRVKEADTPDGQHPFLFDTMSLTEAKRILGAWADAGLVDGPRGYIIAESAGGGTPHKEQNND